MHKLITSIFIAIVSSIPLFGQGDTYKKIDEQVVDFAKKGSYNEALKYIEAVSDTVASDSMRYHLQIRSGQFLIFLGRIEELDSVVHVAHTGFDRMQIDSMAFVAYYKIANKLRESSYMDKAKVYYKKALDYSEKDGLERLKIDALNSYGTMMRRVEKDMARAMELYYESAELAKQLGDSSGLYYAYGNMANTFSSMKNFEKSIEYNLKVKEIIERLGESRSMTNLYTNIGWTYFNYGDTVNMEKYYKLAVIDANARKDTISMIYSYNNLGSLYSDIDKYDSSTLLLESAVTFSEAVGYPYLRHMSGMSLGEVLFKKGEKQTGMELMLTSKKGLIENGAKPNNFSSFLSISDAYHELGNLNQAIINAEEIYKVADERNAISTKLYALEKLHLYYSEANRHLKAYETVNELLDLRNELFDETKASIVGGMEAERSLLRKQEEYELLAKETEIKTARLKTQKATFTLIASILIATVVIVFLLYRQQKVKKSLAEKDKQLVTSELEYKNQELINFAVQITKKNEFIESLNEKIKQRKVGELKELEEIIKANESITRDREEFDSYVQNVYEGFFVKLSKMHPDLTASEKRLAALLRLDLSSKEISTVLNISPKSVDMSRYRLRKKMNLDAADSLPETLQSI